MLYYQRDFLNNYFISIQVIRNRMRIINIRILKVKNVLN